MPSATGLQIARDLTRGLWNICAGIERLNFVAHLGAKPGAWPPARHYLQEGPIGVPERCQLGCLSSAQRLIVVIIIITFDRQI
jgi:hypothetical protein